MKGPVAVAIGLLLRDRKVLLLRRETKPMAGRWEFPGGKLRAGESPEHALRRELQEEVGWSVEGLQLFGVYSHVYALPEGEVHYVLLAYTGLAPEGTPPANGAFAGRSEIRNLDVVAGSRSIVDDLVRRDLI